jgi:hypothetical protein
MAELTQIQTFTLLVLAIIAVRYMWGDVFNYLSRRQSNKALSEIVEKVGKDLENGRNNRRRKESSSKKPS